MNKHSDLSGAELHGTRIPSSSINRPPAYAGEAVIISGGNLAIAHGPIQADWRVYQPASNAASVFSWAINLATYDHPPGQRPTHAALLWKDCTATEANQFRNGGFFLVKSWEIEQDFALKSAINLTSEIQKRGIGCYVFVLGRGDAYGEFFPLNNFLLSTAIAIPQNGLVLFDFDAAFSGVLTEYSGVLQWTELNGFEVKTPLSQVVLRVDTN